MDTSDPASDQQQNCSTEPVCDNNVAVSAQATASSAATKTQNDWPRVNPKTTQVACSPPVAVHAHSAQRVIAHAHKPTAHAHSSQEVSSCSTLRPLPMAPSTAGFTRLSGREYQDKLAELRKVCQDSEEDGEGRLVPTYQAYLAQHGYMLGRTLGCGSYSKVKRATLYGSPSTCPEKVAIKLVDRAKAPQDYQNKFLPRELKLWPKLRHRHLVALKEWFEDARRVYMVLEYVEGGDTLRYIQGHGAVSEARARRWTRQTAEAVNYLHELDISHRDLKLENLLLTRNLDIKVCDFGFIKPESSMDLSRTYCGSKSYAAPEILLGQPYQPLKADSWALGVILYIFVVGKMPFDETRGSRHILDEQRRLSFPWRSLPHISQSCRQLIHLLFTWAFGDRPEVSDALKDPWFTRGETLPAGDPKRPVLGQGDLTTAGPTAT